MGQLCALSVRLLAVAFVDLSTLLVPPVGLKG